MSKEAMKLALEALEYWDVHGKLHQPTEEAITALREALAEQPAQQEPVAWVLLRKDEDGFEPIQFHGGKQKPELGELKSRFTLRPVCFADSPPAQRTWVGLTDEDIKGEDWVLSAVKEYETYTLQEQLVIEGVAKFAYAIEAKLKEKNT